MKKFDLCQLGSLCYKFSTGSPAIWALIFCPSYLQTEMMYSYTASSVLCWMSIESTIVYVEFLRGLEGKLKGKKEFWVGQQYRKSQNTWDILLKNKKWENRLSPLIIFSFPFLSFFLEHINILSLLVYLMTWLACFWHIRNKTFLSLTGTALEKSAKARKGALLQWGMDDTGEEKQCE